MNLEFELGPIRPPSEAHSLPIRVTRNCPWNRCKFCRAYKDQKFELRSVEEVKQDILAAKAVQDRILDCTGWPGGTEAAFAGELSQPVRTVANWLYAGGKTAFLQDANTLIMPVDDLVKVITFLKETLPSIIRVTMYGRSKTAARRSVEELTRLREAGLSRIHIGLESGYDPLLSLMNKGATAADHIRGGKNVAASGISLCVYVVLGLGGVKMWQDHATETARVINEVNPEYIRLRTLAITKDMTLNREVESGSFVRSSDEQIIEEEKLFIENLSCHSKLVSDHVTDLLPEIEGWLPVDRDRMLAAIDRFQDLTPVERAIFRMGRRLSMYRRLDDLNDPDLSEEVERTMARLGQDGEKGLDENVVYALMERFVRWQS
ncbi:MAG: radical SAM protein [Chloroflexi bacterium]|nr:radical SAM protein [Chloroflexota bacterium]